MYIPQRSHLQSTSGSQAQQLRNRRLARKEACRHGRDAEGGVGGEGTGEVVRHRGC